MKLHANVKDLRGHTYHSLTVTENDPVRIGGVLHWTCACVCGGTVQVTTAALRSGNTKSCGCLRPKPTQVQPVLADVKSITITKPWVVKRVLELAAQSGTKPSTWVSDCLEDWLLKHRSGRPPTADPYRHTERNDDTTANYFV